MTQSGPNKGYELSYKIVQGGAVTREGTVGAEKVTIGRSQSNDIVLDDIRVSDLHAVLNLTKDHRLLLTDLVSEDGTYVGGERVETRVELPHAARVSIGPYHIDFELKLLAETDEGDEDGSRHISAESNRGGMLSAETAATVVDMHERGTKTENEAPSPEGTAADERSLDAKSADAVRNGSVAVEEGHATEPALSVPIDDAREDESAQEEGSSVEQPPESLQNAETGEESTRQAGGAALLPFVAEETEEGGHRGASASSGDPQGDEGDVEGARGEGSPSPLLVDRLVDSAAEAVVRLVFKAWDEPDRVGVDDRSGKKILQVLEIWGDTILNARQYAPDAPGIVLAADGKLQPDFVVDAADLPYSPFVLLRRKEGTFYLHFTEEFSGRIIENGRETSFEYLRVSGRAEKLAKCYRVPLGDETRFVVKLGHVMLVGGFSWPVKRLNIGSGIAFDRLYMSILLVLGLMFGGLTSYLLTLPPPPELTIDEIPDRFAKLIIPKRVEPPPKKIEVKPVTQPKEAPPEVKPEEDRGKTEKKPQLKPGRKAELDQATRDKRAAERALAGLIGNQGFDRGFGPDTSRAAAGLLATTGKSNVTGIRGSRGIGFGGGKGAGGIGVLNTGGGGGSGVGGKGVGYKGRSKKKAKINAGGGESVILGALEKSVIDRVIRDHINQIRYCYAKELTLNPDLAGKVVIKFTIAGNGDVSQTSVKESTVGVKRVEQCIQTRISQLKFPEPKGNGVVIVVYPFFFKPAG